MNKQKIKELELQLLQSKAENNFLTLRVAELEMAQNPMFLLQKIGHFRAKVHINMKSLLVAENTSILNQLHELELDKECERRELKAEISGYRKAMTQAQTVIDVIFGELEKTIQAEGTNNIIYKKVSKSPYAYTEKLKSE